MCDFVAIRLQLGWATLVSPEDAEWVKRYKWTASKSAHNYYAVRLKRVDGKRIKVYLHREIMKPNKNQVVHHEHGNSLDNRRPKLVVCTQRENLEYRKGGQDNAGTG